jgi:hypothetical protein
MRTRADADNERRRTTCANLVEATNIEQHCLWRQWHYRPDPEPTGREVQWEEISLGFWQVIGDLGKDRPVAVSVSFALVNGALVGFYEATSRFVDHDMVKSWMAKNFPAARSWSNAQNFHNTVLDINRQDRRVRALEPPSAAAPAPVCHDRPHGEYDPPCPICDGVVFR